MSTAVALGSRYATELADLALWLGLEDVLIDDRGDLAGPLRAALR